MSLDVINEDEKTDLIRYMRSVMESESNYIGLECESGEEFAEDEMPYDVMSIRVEQKMFTVFQVEYWILKGILNLRPEYQRNLVWDANRKSALIESIMLRIPLPAFYLDENEEGIRTVIDGMQRLSTIDDFLNNRFSLKNMQYLTSCENKTFNQLGTKYQSYILDTALAVNMLDARCPQMVKFDVFRRVNTGGLQLNPQEIRNIMADPKVRNLLKEMSTCQEFITATCGGVNDVRMGAQELCLRYLAILFTYQWDGNILVNYKGLMKTMDATVLCLNDFSEEKLCRIKMKFQKVMKQCHMILGEQSFCKLNNKKKVNASLFTSWAVVLAHLDISCDVMKKQAKGIWNRYEKVLSEDDCFYDAITSSTGVRKNILLSLSTIRDIVEGVL